jgi:hypothetical protein
MKTFKNTAAQGDMLIRRINDIPSNAKESEPDSKGHLVVTHSETGHNHVIDATPQVTLYQDPSDPLKAFLSVIGAPCLLEHLRPFDTHEALEIPPGHYEVRRQREYTSEGYRRVQD